MICMNPQPSKTDQEFKYYLCALGFPMLFSMMYKLSFPHLFGFSSIFLVIAPKDPNSEDTEEGVAAGVDEEPNNEGELLWE